MIEVLDIDVGHHQQEELDSGMASSISTSSQEDMEEGASRLQQGHSAADLSWHQVSNSEQKQEHEHDTSGSRPEANNSDSNSSSSSSNNSDEAKEGDDGEEEEDEFDSLLECPVCLEAPRKGPVFTCTNGHLIVSTFYCKIILIAIWE